MIKSIFNHKYLEHLFFVFALVLGGWKLYEVHDERSWEKVRGEVVSTRIQHNNAKYIPRIEYKYCYQGSCFNSTRVTKGRNRGYRKNNDAAEILLSNLVRRGEPIVFVNPSNPEESILIKQHYLLGLLYILVALTILIRIFYKKVHREEKEKK